MKIVVTVASLHGGGAEYVARTWMGWLAQRGHEVTAVLTGRDADPRYLPPNVAVLSLADHSTQTAKVRNLRRILSEKRPDVALSLQMHSNLTMLSAVRLLAAADRPAAVVSERNLVSLGLADASWRHRLKVAVAKRAYRRADAVIAISHPVAGELVAGFGIDGDRLYVVPNPATAKVSPAFSKPRQFMAGDAIDLILPCRLVVQKRPELALLTAAELQTRGFSVRVVSYGEGPLLVSLRAKAAELGVLLDHRGWVENWPNEDSGSARVVLLPSAREGFGNVLVEAAAAGIPSVAVSGALGVADAVVPGVSGELSLTADPSDLADAVSSAASIDMTAAARWLNRFSEDGSGRLLEKTLARAVAQRR